MPRFHFHLHEDGICQDDEGMELPDALAAYEMAIKGVRSLLGEQVHSGELHLNWWIEVTDHAGTEIFQIPYQEAIEIAVA